MEKTTIEITLCGGRWLVNGKKANELNGVELAFLEAFFRELKFKEK